MSRGHHDYLRSGYLHHRLPVMGFVNHYRDNAITYKAQRDKNAARTEAGERGNYRHADVMMLLRSMQNTRSEVDAKAENDALRDDVAAGRRRLHISSLSVSA